MYTDEQIKTACYLYNKHQRLGTLTELPEWVRPARSAYYSLKQKNKRREAGIIPRTTHILPEDGIIDEVAITIATKGTRVVNLTRNERLIVVSNLMELGFGYVIIAQRLGASETRARDWMKKVEAGEAKLALELLASQHSE